MKQRNLFRMGGWLVACLWLTVACQSSSLAEEEGETAGEGPFLEFQVFSQAVRTGSPTTQRPEEVNIRKLYVYAFDDVHLRPDFYWDVFDNKGEGAVQQYSVQMRINGLGKKRFYFLANPPRYIESELTYQCSEGKLRSMTMELQQPLTDIRQLPQSSDGVSSPGDTGFPMANQFTAYVQPGHHQGYLRLTAQPSDSNPQAHIISIPVFRSLGKVTVNIRKREADQEDVAVQSLQLFHYTCNGRFLPWWDVRQPVWEDEQWSPNARLDLDELEKYEKLVGVQKVPLLKQTVPVTSSEPQTLTSFYLCQNSYGHPLPGETQPGILDVNGNRTTKLAVALNDGRQSVVKFPYLRRNDHLEVDIVVAKNKIDITFLPWNDSEVTPDWNEEILPNPLLQ